MPQIPIRIARLRPTDEVIKVRPIVGQTGPIGTRTSPTPAPVPSIAGSVFVAKHKDFIDQVVSLDHCFHRDEIRRFTPEELEEHINVALQDNYIIEDGRTGSFCTGQVAWRLRELTKGYVYERL